MTVQGIILLDIIGLLLIAAIINLVRTRKLYAGFAVVWLLAAMSMMLIISIPPLLAFVTAAVGAVFPASALTMLAFMLVFAMLILFSVQISTLATRQVELAQALAFKELEEREARAGWGDHSG